MVQRILIFLLAWLPLFASWACAQDVLVEAEAFNDTGGWFTDQQFMDIMGSPYLLAHGIGEPVENAATEVIFPEIGTYRLWVRTKDWLPPHHPGTFRVLLDGQPCGTTFGTVGQGWLWQDGGSVSIDTPRVRLELEDLTGFDGRCDALFFSKDSATTPPNEPGREMARWRRNLLGLPETPPAAGEFDAVVIGGGIAGCCAALTAGRLGLNVALIQDRPVLGGNASTEIGIQPEGIGGPIVDEVVKHRGYQRYRLLASEPSLRVFLGWHAFRVGTDGERITHVDAAKVMRSPYQKDDDHEVSTQLRFVAPVFIDCTGDGSIGYWAGADWRMGRESRAQHGESLAPETPDDMLLGTSILWTAPRQEEPCPFPELPWAQSAGLEKLRWTYKRETFRRGSWQWEYGHHLDTIRNAEKIRDHLLRVIYGTWSNAKNGAQKEELSHFKLTNVPPVAGKRESRRLMGDYVLTQNDIVEKRTFADAVVTRSWPIDLHYPLSHYPDRPDIDFIAKAEYLRIEPTEVPFRCLYSRNIENLMMAGRDVSATHVAHGSLRVMKTGGQMGVAVGAAASLCVAHDTTPRGVYEAHLDRLLRLVGNQPGPEQAAAP
ncbi:MAG: FAD-dependent oxidoreductase [Candidatus Brocadiia bacterium]